MRRLTPLPALGALALSAVILAGCATEQKRVLHFGMQEAPEGKSLVWPAPPDVPRYLYAGELTGEANFRTPEREAVDGVASFFRWAVGLILGEKQPVTLQRPQSGAVDESGRIYVTDMSRQAVFVFDPQAGELLVWDKAEGLANFAGPVGITVGFGGRIYVADAELGIVASLDRDGNPGQSMGRGVLKRPTGLAYDPLRQRLYVADTYAHDIKVFDAAGKLVRTLGRAGEESGEFNYPTYLAFAKGRLYVTDALNARIQIFGGEGPEFEQKFGLRGLYVGNLVRPKGVAADSDGNVYVIESYYDHLLIFNAAGRFLMPIGGVGTQTGKFYLPAGVWVDNRNRVFVADMFNGRVVVFQYLEVGG